MNKFTVFGSLIFFIIASYGCTSNESAVVSRIQKVDAKVDSLAKIVTENSYNISNLKNTSAPTNNVHDKILNNQIKNLEKQVLWLKEEYTKEQIKSISPLKEDEAITKIPKVTKVAKTKIQPKSKENIDKLYNRGRKLYLNFDYVKAEEVFSRLIRKYPTSKFASNSQYWLGEILYDRNKILESIDEFQKVIDDYPNSSKAPDAHLKIAICYIKLENFEQAKIELKQLKKNHPNYQRMQKLNSLLEELK